jgi:hypothetical protein
MIIKSSSPFCNFELNQCKNEKQLLQIFIYSILLFVDEGRFSSSNYYQ